MSRQRFYTGVGSRSTPNDILDLMERYASLLKNEGVWLRSGRAKGADTAFEYAAGSLAELYIPWWNFERHRDTNGIPKIICPSGELLDDALTVAESVHPGWHKCSNGARLLHARNVFQVWGADLDTPSDFVILWAEPQGRSVKGGTRTALEVARKAEIPVYNLWYERDRCLLDEMLQFEFGAKI